jgi:3-methyladenine DNA glycosylase AlkC
MVQRGRDDPTKAFPKIRILAASDSWQEREVAATALVEISKKQPEAVLREMHQWATDTDANIRRTASEGLRHVARNSPATVVPVLELLHSDPELYVRKSVGNILRNASNKHPDFVIEICRRWLRRADSLTNWTIKDGLKKLLKTRPKEAQKILGSLN